MAALRTRERRISRHVLAANDPIGESRSWSKHFRSMRVGAHIKFSASSIATRVNILETLLVLATRRCALTERVRLSAMRWWTHERARLYVSASLARLAASGTSLLRIGGEHPLTGDES